MTGRPRDEFTPYWLQTAVPFGTTPQPPWHSVRIPRPTPDYLDGSAYWASTPTSEVRPSSPTEGARGLLYSYSQPDEPWSGQSPPSIWDSSPWGTAQVPWRGLASFPLPDNPWPTPPQRRDRFDSEDAAKSFRSGLAQGVLGLAGTFGNTREQIANSAQQLTDYLAPGYGSTVGHFVSRGLRSLPYMNGPSTSEIQERIEPLTGPFYQPQTVTGDYLRTLGEFTPGLFGPGGILRNGMRNVVVPALSSETVGQWTKGTWYEPYARALAAFAAGAAGHLPGASRPGPVAEQLPPSGTGDPTVRSANAPSAPDVLYGKESSGLLVPPAMPPRPFKADYPSGAAADASGRLLTDIEGRPLHAEYIAGRRVAGGPDVGLTPPDIWDVVIKGTGGAPREVSLPKGVSGSYTPQTDRAGQWVPPEIGINGELKNEDKVLAMAHEAGHLAHDLATKMSLDSVRKLQAELTRVYDLVIEPMRGMPRPTIPQYLGYSDREAPFELIADGMRSYMINPNFFKSVAPNAAALFRSWVNSHPRLSKLIQLNGLGGFAVLGAATNEETDENPHT